MLNDIPNILGYNSLDDLYDVTDELVADYREDKLERIKEKDLGLLVSTYGVTDRVMDIFRELKDIVDKKFNVEFRYEEGYDGITGKLLYFGEAYKKGNR